MKKLIPYILAYVIVATATAVYPRVYMQLYMRFHTQPPPYTYPHGSVAIVLNPGVSHDELIAKLQQVGLSEAKGQPDSPRPSLYPTLVHHYVFDAVMLSAFAGLVNFVSA